MHTSTYIRLLVPVDYDDPYVARDAEAFMSKEKAIAAGLSCIESYGSYAEWTKDVIEENKALFLRDEECECCYLVDIPLHYA